MNGEQNQNFSPQSNNPNFNSNPGPVFESKPGWGGIFINWLKKLFSSTTFLIIIVLAIVIVTIFFVSTREGDEDLSLDDSVISDENNFGDLLNGDSRDNIPPIQFDSETYKVTTQKGEGITHLARRALKLYLNENNNPNITPEHKVYIEDYLKDQKGSRLLEVGETLEFTLINIEMAIAKAEELNEGELKNLSKYANSISSF